MTSARTGSRPAARRPAAKRPPARRPAAKRPQAARRRGSSSPWALRYWWPAMVLGVAMVLALAWRAERSAPAPTTALCTVPSTSVTLGAEQWANAQVIADVGRQRGLPERAVVIALATAMQESTLRNLDHGDRDSLGLFQQRPSQGWGTPAQVQDPVYAAGRFYDHLVEVPGWETRRLTDAADTVQRSAFPEAYQRWEAFAQSLTAALRSDDRERNCG
ncbi:hypothetical protein [Geodermatophilus sp. SYSU D00710]